MVCGTEMGAAELRTVPYRSLPGVWLLDMEVRVCPSCGEEEVSIPAVNQLDGLLVRTLARKPGALTGAEVRFLRKHLGWSGKDFAEKFGVTPETVSRWEAGRSMGALAARLLRVCATRLEPIHDYAALEPVLLAPEAEQHVGDLRARHAEAGWSVAA